MQSSNRRIKKPVPVKPNSINHGYHNESSNDMNVSIYDHVFDVNFDNSYLNEHENLQAPKPNREIAIFMCVQCKSTQEGIVRVTERLLSLEKDFENLMIRLEHKPE
ncbi:hypothetical protein AYI69_g6033 [Smittium culicis]|uniref:Uncharacterized protein n=1 Tax=Smittium culicis TaxID=133412 RepID=A0A1R1Y1Z2_9FUNG|nr:hypothetical protein AYI69_g6033 [Smittium culicis]